MKILFVVSDFYPRIGGGENYVLNLARELGRKNGIFVLCPDEMDKGHKRIFNFTVHYLPYYKIFGNKFVKPLILFEQIKKIKPDVVYVSGPSISSFFIVLFAKFLLRKKVVITYQADLDLHKTSSRFFTYIFFKTCLPFYDKIVVTTKKYEKILRKRKINRSKVFVVPVGFENRNMKENVKCSEVSKTQLLFVGALDKDHRYKNFKTLLCAMKHLDEKFVLTVVGGGELKEYYAEMSGKMGLKNVKFLGKLSDDDLDGQYELASVLILPSNSEQEGFGIVLLEALSFGCKIVTGKECGGAFLVEENENFGKLYDGTVGDLVTKIEEASEMKADTHEIKEKIKRFEWSKVANDIFEIINS